MRGLGALAVLLARCVAAVAREGLSLRATLKALDDVGTRSLWLVTSGMAFFGAVLVTIANAQARRFTGTISVLGAPYFELMVREAGPLLAAALAASRAGAGVSAELAAQTVNGQVEALEMSAGDALSDLVAPRLVAGLIAVPLLCVVGTLTAAFSAGLTAWLVTGIDGRAFLDPRFVDASDVLAGALKALACGLFIPLAAAQAGLSATGGTPGVGEATTRGVVSAVLVCLVVDFVVTLAFLAVGL
jgi:phospholipid/cholesterol/gamma-HCH transport system permease protein